MELYFNVTGERRKTLVQTIGKITHTAPVYKGTFNRLFAIGNMTLDKDGVLRLAEETEQDFINELIAALTEYGFPGRKNAIICIEMPLDGFTDATLVNLERLVASKATLIKKAVGAKTLLIERARTMIRFPWFSTESTPEAVDAYTMFISRLCITAKEKKRVTAVERNVENEKYAFRCFLLKLGFIGNEYKATRKILLASLEGDSAWHNAESKKVSRNQRKCLRS